MLQLVINEDARVVVESRRPTGLRTANSRLSLGREAREEQPRPRLPRATFSIPKQMRRAAKAMRTGDTHFYVE